MTGDDRDSGVAEPEDGRGRPQGRWDVVPPSGDALAGGLLDDLPEQGRGAGALRYPALRTPQAAPRRPGLNPDRPPVDPLPRVAQWSPFSQQGRPSVPAPEEPSEPPPEPVRQPNVIPFRSATVERTLPPRQPVQPSPPSDSVPPPPAPPQDAPAPSVPAEPETDGETVNAAAAAVPFPDPVETEPATEEPVPALLEPAPAAEAAPEAAPEPPEPPVPPVQPASTPRPAPLQPGPQYLEQSAAPAAHAYSEAERATVYRAIRERRDVRAGFRPDPVPDAVLTRVLQAAHQAPSVGFSQPWDFVVISDSEVRTRVRDLVQRQSEDYARALPGARARAFSGLKVEAILDTPVNVVVTVDPTRGGRPSLGRHAQPHAAGYSAALAVENLWLAARAEGLGVGWVSFSAERELARALDLPPHLQVVAYLCVGYVEDFPTEPELSLGGWAQRRPLSWAVHHDHYGQRGLPGEQPTSLLEETVAAIAPLNQRAVGEARDRQARMTKPAGSLGVLEDLSAQLAGLTGECPAPLPEPATVAVFAADHGVEAQGVTIWPREVTAQMVRNFLAGGAVVNAFAAQVGAEVTVVDVGVVEDLPEGPGLLPRKIARGTADMTLGPAMTRTQAGYALEAGIEVARDLVAAGNRCLVTGDMGIANTTASAALVAAFTGQDPAVVTGRGTGVDDAMHEHKIEIVRAALRVNSIDPHDPVGVLAAVGGLEHAALTGFILGAAALRVPVVIDGVIAASAALAAVALAPDAVHACIAGHRSTEPGHTVALDHLALRPLVDLEMRLGEGSGALLAVPLVQAAARALRDVATFDDAGIAQRG
ncbi:nicotinate-nucleotide--dimethylbenzimidazole phosphoribosyltransferase [Nocardiopsis ansamitocini]|uniref:Nicotinate-nucleotide--dimethylbenzimidazole phosphoribosyltransferase n=1 Tax=Nocardiopsis ansamitocini TaxID=1670832 RepID=A0A9W6UIN8_9ACTN|nr:nicotinate-nucleotide--dimethylbenzimidazole phosphoribosyltransferase [Nocardiopsis ansamitocini]GLU47914.1 hypothetical protein Nans01_22650 [Nocardiopsis ansamitocini]